MTPGLGVPGVAPSEPPRQWAARSLESGDPPCPARGTQQEILRPSQCTGVSRPEDQLQAENPGVLGSHPDPQGLPTLTLAQRPRVQPKLLTDGTCTAVPALRWAQGSLSVPPLDGAAESTHLHL